MRREHRIRYLVFYCVHVVVKVKTKNVTCVLFTWIDIVFCEECLAYFRSFKKKYGDQRQNPPHSNTSTVTIMHITFYKVHIYSNGNYIKYLYLLVYIQQITCRCNVFTNVNICPYEAIYLPVDCCFGELVLLVACWSSTNQTASTLS